MPAELKKTIRSPFSGYSAYVSKLKHLATESHRSEDEIAHLSRSLVLLSDPFENTVGFYPSVRPEGFAQLKKLARQNYFDDADFHLKASVDNLQKA
jgi:hypothetical protein